MHLLHISNFSLGGDTFLKSPCTPGTRATSVATSALPTPTSTGYSQAFLHAPSTTGEFNMNSLMEPDFCAISALNQLSNSSVPFHSDTMGDEAKKSPEERSGKRSKLKPKTSLFNRVMAKKAISKRSKLKPKTSLFNRVMAK